MDVNGKSIMGVMMLAAECGSELNIIIDGPDEEYLLKEIIERGCSLVVERSTPDRQVAGSIPSTLTFFNF